MKKVKKAIFLIAKQSLFFGLAIAIQPKALIPILFIWIGVIGLGASIGYIQAQKQSNQF